MRSGRYLHNFKSLLATAFFATAAVVVLDSPANAQRGKGHGKNGGGPPGHQKQMSRQQWGGNGQKPGGGNPHRQMQWGGNNGRAQQPQTRVRNVPAQQNRAVQWVNRGQELMKAQRQQARQQQQQYRQVQRQQQINAWNVRQQMMQQHAPRRQQARQEQASRQQYMRQYRSAERQQARQQRQTQWHQRPAESVRARRKQAYASPVQIAPGFTWTGRQWGQANAAANRYRRDQKQAWKAERKEQRRFEKEQRRYARNRNRNYDYNYYGNYGSNFYGNDYDYDRPSWKQQLLRTVIVGFLSDGGERVGNYDSSYTRGYDRPAYYSEDVPRYYNSPIYVGYSPDLADRPEYYYSDYGPEADDGFDLGGIIGQLPIQELLTSFAGDGFVSELLGGLLVQGYDEGFLAGQAAREYGYDDNYYDNPYVFEGGFCDPYSVSIGDNRELLGEGYAIGYRDALGGRDDYDPYSEGNVDLVSALLSGVLGRV